MRVRGRVALVIVAAAMSWLLWACSTTTRHRVLNFFFDGVPPPGSATVTSGDALARGEADSAGPVPKAVRKAVTIYPHPPYRENRCSSCHDRTTGQMFRSIEDGLCATCHADVPGDARFVHGPVAVNACLTCHHYHGTTRPKMLLEDPVELCWMCHDEADLGEGPHHAVAGETACTSCHDPHGGDNQFFIKRTAP